MKNIFKTITIVTLLTALMTSVAFADSIWDEQVKATKSVEAGKYDEAVKSWIKLLELYDNNPEKMNLINYAMYAEKIGDYYSGKYSQSNLNRPLAVKYFDISRSTYTKLGPSYEWGVIQTKNKADKLRVVIDVYTMRLATESDTPKNLAKFEPESGTYLGIYGEPDKRLIKNYQFDPTLVKDTFGRQHSLYLLYAKWGINQFPSHYKNTLINTGGGLEIALEPTGGLSQVKEDEYIRKWAKDAKEAGFPVFLRFAGEMNGDWVAWGKDPKSYVEKFRLVHDIMAELAPNVAMVWSPNDVPWQDMDKYYPGDEYVDWVGVSSYMMPDNAQGTELSNWNLSQLDKLSLVYEEYGDRKPIMLSESAIAYKLSGTFATTDFSKWYRLNMDRLYQYIPMVYPRIKAIVYYDNNSSKSSKEDPLNPRHYFSLSDTTATNIYKELIAQPHLVTKIDGTSHIVYDNVEKTPVQKGKIRLSSYVRIYEPFVSKVEYFIDGKLVQTSTKIPYDFVGDFSKSQNNSKLLIKVYDSNNTLAGEKEISISFKQK